MIQSILYIHMNKCIHSHIYIYTYIYREDDWNDPIDSRSSEEKFAAVNTRVASLSTSFRFHIKKIRLVSNSVIVILVTVDVNKHCHQNYYYSNDACYRDNHCISINTGSMYG
jgi:hypothetical protein